MNKSFNISALITKKIKGNISTEESAALDQWVNKSSENKVLYEKVYQDDHLLEKLEIYTIFDKEAAWQRIKNQVNDDNKIIPLHSKLVRYAAIILPFLVLGFAAYYFLNVYDKESEQVVIEEILPGTEKATLILADGSQIILESEDSPKEILRDDIKIDNSFQMLKYPEITEQKLSVYHELITPKGGKYGIVLPDGSEVFLNAGSSLRYPTVFQDDKREIFLIGEAYLKVRKSDIPFIVSCTDMDISVLGTTFNIEAYDDESIHRTTLIEGKVMVNADGLPGQILDPEEQAVLDLADKQLRKIQVNTSQYTSWIDGKFEFAHDNLETVMRKLSRWYDFEYEFENPDAKEFHFSARIDDKQDISTILDMLEMTTSVKFEIKDDKRIVIL